MNTRSLLTFLGSFAALVLLRLYFGGWLSQYVSPLLALIFLTGVIAPAQAGRSWFARMPWAYATPLLAYFVADIVFALVIYPDYGFNSMAWLIYPLVLALVAFGQYARRRPGVARLVVSGFAGITLFDLLTNFFSWYGSDWYPQTWAGLVEAYVMAWPFYRAKLVGLAVVLAGYLALRRVVPALFEPAGAR